MTNLTASEARRLIERLHHNQTKEHGISILEEKYLIGLEKALPILETIDIDSEALAVARKIMEITRGPLPVGGYVQLLAKIQCLVIDAMKVSRGENNLSLQQPQTDTYRQIENDGWIEWGGGRRPTSLSVNCFVEYRSRGGDAGECLAGLLRWTKSGRASDIIAYRVIEQQEREQGEEE